MNERIASRWLRKGWAGRFRLLFALSAFGSGALSAAAVEMHLMTVPLYCSGGNTISNIFRSVPNGTVFYLWDPDLLTFSATLKGSNGLWTGGGRQVFPGEGFFYQPAGLLEPIVFNGNAPTSPVAIAVSARPVLLGHPLGSNVVWTQTALAEALPPGSIVSFWNSIDGWYKAFSKAPVAKGGGWGNEAAGFVVGAFDGFAVRQPPGASPLLWSE